MDFYGMESPAKALSVGEVNAWIKNLFDRDPILKNLTVSGEISNFKFHSSGHFYFSLKDESGQISCVMFRSSVANVRFRPEDGMKVTVTGSVSVYPKSGSYQIYVTSMKQAGIGDLYVKFEEMKRRLMETIISAIGY